MISLIRKKEFHLTIIAITGIDQAIEHFEAALYAAAHSNIGIAYRRKGMLDKSIGYFQAALRLKPDSADNHYNLGNAYYMKGQLDNSITEYNTALALRPDDTAIRNRLSDVSALRGH